MNPTAPRNPALSQFATAFLVVACVCCVAAVWCMFNGTWRGIALFALGTLCAGGAHLALHAIDRLERKSDGRPLG